MDGTLTQAFPQNKMQDTSTHKPKIQEKYGDLTSYKHTLDAKKVKSHSIPALKLMYLNLHSYSCP